MSSALVKDKNLNGRFGPKRGAIKATTSKKNTGSFHKLLVFIGLREEEEEVISEAEKMRRYAIAMAGWKKVKKTLTVIRYRGADMFQSSALPTKRASIMSYSNFVIPPNSRFGFLWRTIKALLVTYNLIIVPYRVSFGNFSHTLIVIDWYMDGFFVADIFVNFLSAFNRRTKVVKDFKSIAIHYVFTQLWIDLISIFPYYWTTPVDKYYFLRYFRFLQIFKANEQLKTFCEAVLLHVTANITVVKSLSRILNFVIFLAIIGNLLASIWYSLGQKKNVQVGQGTDFKISGWINDLTANSPQVTLYIASLYWTFTTLTTVGYGDIVGHTTEEYIYTMVVEFIGVFLFAYLMSNINNLIQKLESGNVEILENKTEELDQWILKIDRANRDRKLPTDLVDEVKFFFRNYWQKDHTTIQNDEAFLNQMPRDLRSKLIKHLFSKFIDRFSVFFDGLEEAFADEIVINLVPRKFTKNTDIVKIDHGAKYVYFILKGRVTVCSQDAVDEYLTLENNTYFGEHLIFFKLKSSNAFRACDEEVECMCLPKAKFVELCQEFPASAKILKYKAYLRRKHYRKAKLEVQLAHEKKLSSQKQWKLDICKMDDTLNENESEDNNAKSEKSAGKNTEVSGEAFLEQAKKLKNALDRIEKQINTVEGDLTKKLKNIKYYIGYISSIEDFLPAAE